MKFRKKPVVIEAIQFNGKNYNEIQEFTKNFTTYSQSCEAIFIRTLEGKMTALKDDWIIKGVNGEFYPCKPDIFKKTYDPIN